MSKEPESKSSQGHSENGGKGLARRSLLKASSSLLAVSAISDFAAPARAQQAQPTPPRGLATLDRTVLPPQPPSFRGKIGETYKDSVPDWRPSLPLTAPEGAPNILMIVLDDVGYGQLGCYGSPIETPHIDKLAASGLKYVNFHTTALCSPSRGALLTGRNHHSIGLAAITEAATGFPGSFGNIPKSAATIAEVLKQNGYSTLAFGKWHLTPYTNYTAAGPFDRWPLGMGFERFYGFIGGETDQWAPLLVQDNRYIEVSRRDGYHLSEDLVDRTIADIRDQQQANTGRPFFSYLAFGAAHAPLHAPKDYIEKYKGRFDQGWDKVREDTFERQRKMGVIPSNTDLPPDNPGVQAWSELTENQRTVYTRLQEVFAGFLDHADAQIGRLIAALDAMGIRDDTLILLVSDNGASQEGLQNGTANTDRYRNYYPDTVEEMLPLLDKLGGPETDPHYPMGWSMAGNAPLKRWKQDVHHGGNTDPLIISWPRRIKDAGAIRRQYHHLVDIVPTLLELTQLPAPTWVNGAEQMPLPGVSMTYTFDDASAPTRKEVQYYEMLGSRAIWADGWTAVTWHKKDTSWDDEKWELYNTDQDFSETHDLADTNSSKLKELQALWWQEAKKYNVLPLDDRRYERVADPTRPVAAMSLPLYTYYPETSIVHPLAAPQLLGREHVVTAYVEIPDAGADGVLAASGGEFGGWALFMKDKRLHYSHNYLKLHEYAVSSSQPVAAGVHKLSFHFVPKEISLKPDFFVGDVTIAVDGASVGEIKDMKSASQYSAITGYGLQIGRNLFTPVSHEYQPPFPFTGLLEKVTIEVKSGNNELPPVRHPD